MNKTLATLVAIGASTVLLVPATAAYAGGHDDQTDTRDDRGHGRSDDSSTPGDDDGTPDQGRGDAGGPDDSSTPGDDDGTPDQGRGDAGRPDDSRTPGDDDGTADQGKGDNGGSRAGSGNVNRGRDGRVEVRRTGQCSAGAQWRVRIKVRGDRTRIKFQVDSDRVGEEWTYRVVDNGTEILAGTRRTHAPSGDFTVQYRERGTQAGSHDVTATAQSSASGQTCTGSATTPA